MRKDHLLSQISQPRIRESMINELRETSVTIGSNNSMKAITKYQLPQYMSYGWEAAVTEIQQTVATNSVRFFMDYGLFSESDQVLRSNLDV